MAPFTVTIFPAAVAIQLLHKNFTPRGVAIEIPSGMRPLFSATAAEIFGRSGPLVRTSHSLPHSLLGIVGRKGIASSGGGGGGGDDDERENKNREAIIAPAAMGKMRRHARKRGLGFAVWPPQNRRRRREDWHRQDSAWRLAPRLRARYHLVVCQAPGVGGPRKFAEMQLLQSPSTNPQTSPPFATTVVAYF